jgi:hypothetical protein
VPKGERQDREISKEKGVIRSFDQLKSLVDLLGRKSQEKVTFGGYINPKFLEQIIQIFSSESIH